MHPTKISSLRADSLSARGQLHTKTLTETRFSKSGLVHSKSLNHHETGPYLKARSLTHQGYAA